VSGDLDKNANFYEPLANSGIGFSTTGPVFLKFEISF
jgi:hypothetical protein